jgi:predicted  nucleic acid-binding Zn-ribbon protein
VRNYAREDSPFDHKDVASQAGKDIATMCLDCGCGELNESHGDPRHITMDTVRAAAEASDIPVQQAMDNIHAGLDQAKSESAAD